MDTSLLKCRKLNFPAVYNFRAERSSNNVFLIVCMMALGYFFMFFLLQFPQDIGTLWLCLDMLCVSQRGVSVCG